MEDYVVPEFYDVLVGGETGTSGPGPGGGNVIKSTEGFTWGNEGITNNGTTVTIPGGVAYTFEYAGFSITVDGNDTVDSVNKKMNDLNLSWAQRGALQGYAFTCGCNA